MLLIAPLPHPFGMPAIYADGTGGDAGKADRTGADALATRVPDLHKRDTHDEDGPRTP